MNYQQTIDFLYSRLPAYHRIGKAAYKSNLDNTLALDRHLGHPHLKFRSVHIGGTNGKGSVSHMIASILQESGFRTGLYTSPHLKDFRERIRVNGKMIPERAVVDFVERHMEIIELLKPSFFEMTVGMAFDHFAAESVDIAVIEVGLGGRLDSTNIITPVLSVITNIGHDHMDLLGNTPEKIAAEKAGIIKKGVPAVIGETQPETEKVFMKKASESESKIFFADRDLTCTLGEFNGSGLRTYAVRDEMTNKEFTGSTPLGGDYQVKNIKTVIEACRILGNILNIKNEDILSGIRNVIVNTGLMGRWQQIGNNPMVICDTGHNREGLEYVITQLARIRKGKIHFVIGFVKDKKLEDVLPLFPGDAEYYFTKAGVERALDESVLRDSAFKYGLHGRSYRTVNEAVNAAKAEAAPSDIIFIGGSTFIVAEVK